MILAQSKRPREHSGRIIRATPLALRLEALGYSLHTNCIDSFGRTWSYRTFPMHSGPVGQFDAYTQVVRYVESIEQIRSMQGE